MYAADGALPQPTEMQSAGNSLPRPSRDYFHIHYSFPRHTHTHSPSHLIPHLLSSNQTLDIAHYGWGAAAGWAGVDLDRFPAVQAWLDRMEAREGVEKGRHVPDPHTMRELLKDKAKIAEQAAKSRAWVQAGMKEDAEQQK